MAERVALAAFGIASVVVSDVAPVRWSQLFFLLVTSSGPVS